MERTYGRARFVRSQVNGEKSVLITKAEGVDGFVYRWTRFGPLCNSTHYECTQCARLLRHHGQYPKRSVRVWQHKWLRDDPNHPPKGPHVCQPLPGFEYLTELREEDETSTTEEEDSALFLTPKFENPSMSFPKAEFPSKSFIPFSVPQVSYLNTLTPSPTKLDLPYCPEEDPYKDFISPPLVIDTSKDFDIG